MSDCRTYSPRDVDQIVALVRAHTPAPRYSLDYFRWKFSYQVDHLGERVRPIGVVAAEDETVIAFAAFVPCRLSDGSLLWNVDDVVVHGAHRRKGVFRQLMRFGLSFTDARGDPTYLIPSSAARSTYLSMGFETLFDIDHFFLIPRWSDLLGTWGKPARLLGRYVDRLRDRTQRNATSSSLEVLPVESFPTGIERVDLPAAGWLAFHKDAAFLEWRFSRHPLTSFERFLLRSGGELVGYAVLSGTGLMDFAVADGRFYADVFAFSADYSHRKNVPASNLMMHAPADVARVAARAGFHRARRAWLAPDSDHRRTILLRDPAHPEPRQRWEKLFFRAADIDCGY